MNLVKIADLLKGASDQELTQELQNPSGSVPSYMVLSELDRRKKMRGSVMNQEPQSSVAEDMEAEASQANQMGIGSLQLQQMPQEQAYAGGGEVQHFLAGGLPKGYDPAIWEMYEDPTSGEVYPRKKLAGMAAYGAELRAKAQGLPSPVPVETPLAAAPTAVPTTETTSRANQSGVRDPNLNPTPQRAAPTAAAAAAPVLSQEAQDLAEARKLGLSGIGEYGDYLKQAIEENKARKAENIGYALMQAGMGMAGGRSQYAMENIGQGALMGLQQLQGAEQARQKEGRAMAMDMAQSGMKKADMYSNLAKAGFEGKKAEAMVEEAKAKSKYYTAAASAQGIKGLGSSDKLDAQQITRLRSDYTKNAADFMFAKKYPTFESYLAAMGYSGSRGPTGGGTSIPGVRDYSEFTR